MLLLAVAMSVSACSKESSSPPTAPAGPLETSGPTLTPPVYVTLFIQIENNAPAGAFGTPASLAELSRLLANGCAAPQRRTPSTPSRLKNTALLAGPHTPETNTSASHKTGLY